MTTGNDMLLQPVVMNVFPSEPISGPQQDPSGDKVFGDAGSSPAFRVIEQAEQLFKAQDKRIANDLASYARNGSSNGRTLDLLRLQYDLDDMQTSAALAKNIADKVGQAITSLTQGK
ncbi:hypothetical protein [Paraburkholderia sediminicola]|uniref:hypothetical protein n=1 Tax=Paraburkholderia sediminicola TaxID=458836 RepID=UPI0038BA5A37